MIRQRLLLCSQQVPRTPSQALAYGTKRSGERQPAISTIGEPTEVEYRLLKSRKRAWVATLAPNQADL